VIEEKTSDSPHSDSRVSFTLFDEYGFYSIKHKDSGRLAENKKSKKKKESKGT